VRLLHELAKIHVRFDDPHLVSHAGLACRLTCVVRVFDMERPPRDDLRVPLTELEDTGGFWANTV
jgi:hypothetical protein